MGYRECCAATVQRIGKAMRSSSKFSCDAAGVLPMRITHRKQQGTRGPRYLIRCGCCDERVEIYYDEDTLEINGVMGSLQQWRSILMPLLANDSPSTSDLTD